MITLSEYLNLGDKLDEEGIFDTILDIDANYFINIKRIKDTKEKNFENSYGRIQQFFRNIYKILSSTTDKNSRLYRQAVRLFDFPEINNIGLGYSKGRYGSGFGPILAEKIISDAKEIIDAGNKDADLFQLIGLFEENVGPDRLSDMYSHLIYDDIINYTNEKNKILGINSENYPEMKFKNGLLINPFKNKPVLLLPKDILHELPIAKEWDDIDYVCSRVQCIRDEMNSFVGDEWKKASTREKKDFIKEKIMKNEENFNAVISEYKDFSVEPYDFDNDSLGYHIISKELKNIPLEEIKITKEEKAKDIVLKICNKFKDLVENNALAKLLYEKNGKFRGEKSVQLLFYGISDSYCEAFDVDISPELNSGRGNIDFKYSKGYKDRVIVEVKLTSNRQLIHGMKTQIMEYAKAEKTNQLVYLVIDDLKDKEKIKKLYDEYNKMDNKPELIVVDTEIKKSASIY